MQRETQGDAGPTLLIAGDMISIPSLTSGRELAPRTPSGADLPDRDAKIAEAKRHGFNDIMVRGRFGEAAGQVCILRKSGR